MLWKKLISTPSIWPHWLHCRKFYRRGARSTQNPIQHPDDQINYRKKELILPLKSYFTFHLVDFKGKMEGGRG